MKTRAGHYITSTEVLRLLSEDQELSDYLGDALEIETDECTPGAFLRETCKMLIDEIHINFTRRKYEEALERGGKL